MKGRTAPAPVQWEALVVGLDDRGRGIARHDDKMTFVDGALPGERVIVERGRRGRRRHRDGVIVELVAASADRVSPRCRHFEVCGGCRLQHMSHQAQLEAKTRRLLDDLSWHGDVAPAEMFPAVAREPWGYRRRARLAVKFVAKKGGALVGFRERYAPFVAELTRCEVLASEVGERLLALRELIGGLQSRSRIPQLEVAVGDRQLAIVVRHLDPLADSDRERLRQFARAEHIQIHLQSGGPDTIVALWPERAPLLSYRLAKFGVTIEFGPADFVQVNGAVNEALVEGAVDLLDLDPGVDVLELYCGIGNFSLAIARGAGALTGVEMAPEMVERARHNARLNAIDNAAFEVADLSAPDGLAPWLDRHWDRLLLDPPKSGASAVIDQLRQPFPARIVYVSCDATSLGRDAGKLVHEKGYALSMAGVVDMFPHTNHAEAVALFERRAR